MQHREAGSSQAAWALLVEGVSAARVEAHRLRALVSRVLKLVEASPEKEHLYQVVGDVISVAPHRLEVLETHLDRTSYALAVIGEDHLRDRLPLADRKLVDEAVERSRPLFGPMVQRSSSRVADMYMQADLTPPLGHPGGPCQVVDRVEAEVMNPRTREEIIDDVEFGLDLSNPDAAAVYDLQVERGAEGTRFKRLIIGPHTAYRMDLRGVTVPAVRAALRGFQQAYSVEKSRGSSLARKWEEDLSRGEPIHWGDPQMRLTVVFKGDGQAAKLITTYWTGESDPRPPGDGGCNK